MNCTVCPRRSHQAFWISVETQSLSWIFRCCTYAVFTTFASTRENGAEMSGLCESFVEPQLCESRIDRMTPTWRSGPLAMKDASRTGDRGNHGQTKVRHTHTHLSNIAAIWFCRIYALSCEKNICTLAVGCWPQQTGSKCRTSWTQCL